MEYVAHSTNQVSGSVIYKLDNSTNHPQKNIFSSISRKSFDERTIITFEIADFFHRHFAIIKGLFEFSRSKEMVLNCDSISKKISVDVADSHVNNVDKVISAVRNQLEAELNFKASLRKILDVEKVHKAETSALITTEYVRISIV